MQPAESTAPARAFARDSRTRSIWWHQLVLGAAVLFVGFVIAVLDPRQLLDDATIPAMLAIIVLSVATLFARWDRVPRRWTIAVPLVDAALIGVLTVSYGSALSFLWVFPVAWIGSYFSWGALVWCLGFIGLATLARALMAGAGTSGSISLIATMSSLIFLGILTHQSSERSRGNLSLLKRQADRLQASVERLSRQQRRTNQLVDAITVGVARFESGGEASTNAAFAALFGAIADDPQSAATEFDARDGNPLIPGSGVVDRARRGDEFDDQLVWVRDFRGRWRAVTASASRLVDEDGDAVLLVVSDVTALLQERERREHLAAVVSHELRNPLTAILGHADLALDGEPDDATRSHLDVIEGAATRMHTLIDELLSDARAPREASDQSVDPADIAMASTESFAPTAAAAGTVLRTEITPGARVHGDGVRLRQAFDNVIGNAVKYTPAGGEVTVIARHDAQRFALEVRDTGIGIPADEVERIFEPYFRASTAEQSGLRGTGLGMGIVRDIVTELGGSIAIDSTPGDGTVVLVEIPLPETAATPGGDA